MSPAITTLLLLIVSNIFMTFAWYGHLKLGQSGVSTNWPLYVVILFSWGIALLDTVFRYRPTEWDLKATAVRFH